MPWLLHFIQIGTQCGACGHVVPAVDDVRPWKDGWKCPNGCVITDGVVVRRVDVATGAPPNVGDCYYQPRFLSEPHYRRDLTEKYFATNAHRPPIIVQLPGYTPWCVDMYAHNENGNHGVGWDVTGDIQPGTPTLTCTPSINCVRVYHGYVQNGVITNDCEGRQFNAAGEKC